MPTAGPYWPIYPEVGHVPFLVAASDVPCSSINALAAPMDVLPTVCDLADVDATPPDPIHGRSLAGVLRSGKGPHRDVVVSGSCLRPQEGSAIQRKAVTPFVVTAEYGYAAIGPDGGPQLFALTSDPLGGVCLLAFVSSSGLRGLRSGLVHHRFGLR